MRIAMLGAGYMGARHAASWARVEGVTVAWVVGHGPKRATSLAGHYGARASTDTRAALDDPEVDAVDVAVLMVHHPALVQPALSAGKHVLFEMPLARTSAEEKRMVHHAREHGTHLHVALLHRFARRTVLFRNHLHSGDFGRTRTVSPITALPAQGESITGMPWRS